MDVLFKQLDETLEAPAYARPGDAGLDLRAAEGGTLLPFERALVPCGIALAVPEGYAGLIIPRSGLAARQGISIVNAPGLIDSGYRGRSRCRSSISIQRRCSITKRASASPNS